MTDDTLILIFTACFLLILLLVVVRWFFLARRSHRELIYTKHRITELGSRTPVLQINDQQNRTWVFTQLPVYIGSDDENDVVIKDNTVSQRHVRLYQPNNSQEICVQDLDSECGLFVDELPTREHIIQNQLQIKLGKIYLNCINLLSLDK